MGKPYSVELRVAAVEREGLDHRVSSSGAVSLTTMLFLLTICPVGEPED